MEAEVPAIDVAEPDGPDVAGGDPVGQEPHSRNGVVRHPERAGEHVGAAAREGAERCIGAGDTGGDFVERSIAAEPDDDVDTAAGSILGESDGVPTTIRLDDLDLVALAESARCTTTVLRAVTEEANALTTSRMRKTATISDVLRLGLVTVWSAVGPGLLLGNNGAPMNVIVCVKQIPDPAMPGELNSSTNTLKREGKLILDESDSYGVEMALQLVATAGEGEVSLVSMAPKRRGQRHAHGLGDGCCQRDSGERSESARAAML